VQQVQHTVEPVEGVGVLVGLQRDPGKDADSGHVDAGLAHQAQVVPPHRLVVVAEGGGPLLGIVVAAEEERR